MNFNFCFLKLVFEQERNLLVFLNKMNCFTLSRIWLLYGWLFGTIIIDIKWIDCQMINCNQSNFKMQSTISLSIIDDIVIQYTVNYKLIKYSFRVRNLDNKNYFYLENGVEENLEQKQKELKRQKIYWLMKKMNPRSHKVSFVAQKILGKMAMIFHIITNPNHGGYTILYKLDSKDIFHEIKLTFINGIYLSYIWPISMLQPETSSAFYFVAHEDVIFLFNNYLFKKEYLVGRVCLVTNNPLMIKLSKDELNFCSSSLEIFQNINFIFTYENIIYLVNNEKLFWFENTFITGENQVEVYSDDLDKRIYCLYDLDYDDHPIGIFFRKYSVYFIVVAIGIIILVIIIIAIVVGTVIGQKKNRKQIYSQNSNFSVINQSKIHRKRYKRPKYYLFEY